MFVTLKMVYQNLSGLDFENTTSLFIAKVFQNSIENILIQVYPLHSFRVNAWAPERM